MGIAPITHLAGSWSRSLRRGSGRAGKHAILSLPGDDRSVCSRERWSVTIAFFKPALVAAALRYGLVVAKQSTQVMDLSFGAILLVEVVLLLFLLVDAFRPALEWLTASVVLPLVDFFQRIGIALRRGAYPAVILVVSAQLHDDGCRGQYVLSRHGLHARSDRRGVQVVRGGAHPRRRGAGRLAGEALVVDLLDRVLGLIALRAANLFYGYIATFGVKSAPDIAWLSSFYAAAVGLDNIAETGLRGRPSSLTCRR